MIMEDDSDQSEVSVGSETRSSYLSLHYSSSSFGDTSSSESEDVDRESIVEPYLYEPEDSEEGSSVDDSGSANDEDDDSRRERLGNTNWNAWQQLAFDIVLSYTCTY